MTLTVERVAKKCGLLLLFKKLANVNCHPMGENSPNLVTLKISKTQKAAQMNTPMRDHQVHRNAFERAQTH
jgi:hypothetical protein